MTAYITRSPDHRYTFEGVEYPGVTGLLKVIDKSDTLIAWAARMTAEAAVELGSGLTALIEATGREGAVKALSARSGWRRDEAAAQGTEIHRLADLLVRGQPTGEVTDLTRERVDRYAEWWSTAGWRVRASEAMVVDPEKGYGGTIDLLCYDGDGRTVLADLKTGKGVYREAILQLYAYGAATWMDTGEGLYENPKPDRYVVLHVTAKGVREIEVSVGKAERDAFAACMTLSAWRDSVKGRL